jgi:hypothetical protein
MTAPMPATTYTTSSGLILPGSQAPGAEGFTQAPGSGLYVPTHAGLQAVAAPRELVIPTRELAEHLDADTVRAQAKQGWQQLASSHGAPVADVLMGAQFPVIEMVAAQERHDQVIADFLAGRLPSAG